jgi:hypothetical protein
MTRMLATLVVVLVAMAALVQAASAKKGARGSAAPSGTVEVETATAQATGDGSTAAATASCPHGTKAAGGGFDAPSSSDVIGLVYESVKVGRGSWRASVQLFDPNDPNTVTLTTYVYCRAHFPNTKTSTDTVPTTGEVQLGPTASASCPGGESALAGGFHMPPPLGAVSVTDLFFDSLRSGDSGWDARVVTGPAGPSTVTSEAYCSKALPPPSEVQAQSAPVGLNWQSGTATAACPAGQTPAAGGFAQPDSNVISFFFLYSSMRVGDSWQVSGLHSGTDPAVALTGAAYCA